MIGTYLPLEQSVECNDSAIRRLKCFILCVIWVDMLHFSPLLHVTRQRLDNLLACFTFHCLSANKTECHADAKRMWLGGLQGKCVTRKSLCKVVNVCIIFFWQVDDVIVSRLGSCTEEGKKVQRNGGKNFLAVFRRIEDPNKDWAFWTCDAAVLLSCQVFSQNKSRQTGIYILNW